MEVEVFSQHIDLGDALVQTVEDKLVDGVQKYSENPIDAKVYFNKDGFEYTCEITVHLSTGLVASSKSRADDIYASADGAIDRMEKQLRRYKRRLKNHHKQREVPIEAFNENAYVIEASEENDSHTDEMDLQPVIIAETQVKVGTMSVGEAVMQMELGQDPFMVFRNTTHGGVNVVFRREDGNIGWIDPRRN